MSKTTSTSTNQLSNRLLAALPRKDYQRLLPKLEPVNLVFGDILYQPGDAITQVYFPNNSIISLLSAVAERSTLEVGIVGNEGMAGISIFMGVAVSSNKFLVQGAGTAMRMKAETLGSEAKNFTAMDRLLRRYSYSLLTQISQSAACNRFHTVNERLARWLLMTHDRSGMDEFQLTQEFMSNMLGVRREGVSKAAGELQRNKFINYSRGVVSILNRPGLEKCACKCYRVIKDSEDALN